MLGGPNLKIMIDLISLGPRYSWHFMCHFAPYFVCHSSLEMRGVVHKFSGDRRQSICA